MKMIKLSNIARDLLQESITQNARSMRYVVDRVLKTLVNSFGLPSEDVYKEYLDKVIEYSSKGASYSDVLKLPLLANEYDIPERIFIDLSSILDDEDLEYIEERFYPTQNFINFLDRSTNNVKEEIKFIFYLQIELEDDLDSAVYRDDTRTVYVYLPLYDLKKYMNVKSFMNYELFFRDMMRIGITHELQHAYDNWQSKGKALIKPEKYITIAHRRLFSQEDFLKYLKAYFDLPFEKAAFLQEALQVFLDDLSKLQSPEDLLRAYKNKELGIISHNPIIKSLLDRFIDTALLPNVKGREITQEQRRKVYKIFYKILSSEMEALEKELNRNK